jgi:pimeloyl-ACP methyl ester carboxylesterase
MAVTSELRGFVNRFAQRAARRAVICSRCVGWQSRRRTTVQLVTATLGRRAHVRLGATVSGSGPVVLLLPALSSISTRGEMRALQECLARRYSTFCIDWPGFGDQARPPVDWTPDVYSTFLSFLLTSVVAQPHAIIAAGHAAGFALKQVASETPPRLVLIAPTWRGPLPTMVGGHRPFFDRLCHLVDAPGLGPFIYWLNVNPFVVRRMGAGHVFVDRAFLAGERLREKLAVVRAPGARFASVR